MRVVQRQSVLQAIVEEEQEVEEPVLHVKVVGSISSVCRSVAYPLLKILLRKVVLHVEPNIFKVMLFTHVIVAGTRKRELLMVHSFCSHISNFSDVGHPSTCTKTTSKSCSTCSGSGYSGYNYYNCSHGYGYGSSHYYCNKSGHSSYRGSSSTHD